MNAPDRGALVALPSGVEKVTVQIDKRVPNAAIYTLQLEDHTIGNLVRMQLLQYPEIEFAGYQMPHPLKNECIIRIQTDGSISPKDALLKAFRDLQTTSISMMKEFDAAVKLAH
ncbi:putative DNA-directed RNA polymerase II [Monocercomonoides exilis]|uniref:putative DNA-directed RNA polymerase II n=1 Tax=Monocercomonoides exilis TaxID=2049356 RepID=UPI00355A06BA|nr:putative DNA-directed RNA polymerase II [Monocercomonoides exilis]